MQRSLKCIVLAASGLISGTFAYKTRDFWDGMFVKIYAAAGSSSPEILRSGFSNDIRTWNKNWDFREPSVFRGLQGYGEEQTKKPSANRHLVFVRHGEYDNAKKDKRLTDKGRQQAIKTGERLKFFPQNTDINGKIDKIVISSMTRAKETGELIRKSLPDVPYEYCDFLTEGAPCIPEPPVWRADKQIFQDSARIESAFRKYVHRADVDQSKETIEVYVCHANVIRYFVCRALQFPPEGWLRLSTGHCGLTWLTIKPNGNVILRTFGDVGHLPPNLTTR
ncbi:serine/threonine-protein phosphatase PGAM5, mitochondrial-like isoform X2 [Xenia sp. Carnegie-2017]|uniref:serine/threonine-protein phosphatase PGAM5, mitochondrial-like isoform X2 n=1 Tax=Xenia sp. Carnegie-2017 TaxID=2897299 RepID=UPI001F03C76A|nr:serine/threonine-protein phosphatase PGAM5, mitochondrial-like isoform X2 [Xenia sp. Carnegie-2017]